VLVRLGIGVVERLAADGAEAGAVVAAEGLRGKRQNEGVVGPAAEIEVSVDDVRAAELLVFGGRLVYLAGVDLEIGCRLLEAANARTGQLSGVAKPERISGGCPGDVESRLASTTGRRVGLAAELDRVELHLEIELAGLARGQRQALEIDDSAFRIHSLRGYLLTLGAQFHWNPETYLEEIRAEVPRYDELQKATVEAIPFAPDRVLELGMGTGETTRVLLEAYPDAWVIGLDSSPDMVYRLREEYDDVQLARMEDPLPDGPWDLVVSVLSVHHLRDDAKRRLFRRVREQSRALVIGDVVKADQQVTPIEPDFDFPDTAEELAEWCDGEITWTADDLAVVRAVYD
jgi:tRNA (cmo5U34)-methyltransferase